MSFFSSIDAFFTSIRNFFADPATTQAVENVEAVVETVTEALVCEIAIGSGLAESVMAQVNADPSTTGTTEKVYVASSLVCSALKGTTTGATAVNVPAITSVSA